MAVRLLTRHRYIALALVGATSLLACSLLACDRQQEPDRATLQRASVWLTQHRFLLRENELKKADPVEMENKDLRTLAAIAAMAPGRCQNQQLALDLDSLVARRGDVETLIEIAIDHRDGKNNRDKDIAKALDFFRVAREQVEPGALAGDADSLAVLARIKGEGLGIAQDLAASRSLWLQAAQAKPKYALSVASLMNYGRTPFDKDRNAALRLLSTIPVTADTLILHRTISELETAGEDVNLAETTAERTQRERQVAHYAAELIRRGDADTLLRALRQVANENQTERVERLLKDFEKATHAQPYRLSTGMIVYASLKYDSELMAAANRLRASSVRRAVTEYKELVRTANERCGSALGEEFWFSEAEGIHWSTFSPSLDLEFAATRIESSAKSLKRSGFRPLLGNGELTAYAWAWWRHSNDLREQGIPLRFDASEPHVQVDHRALAAELYGVLKTADDSTPISAFDIAQLTGQRTRPSKRNATAGSEFADLIPRSQRADPARDGQAKHVERLPSTGLIAGEPVLATGGRSTFTVDNSKGGMHAEVRLYVEGRLPAVRSFFVKEGESFKLTGVKAGDYVMRYRDVRAGQVYEADTVFKLHEERTSEGVRFSNVRVTLFKVSDGNMHVSKIPADRF